MTEDDKKELRTELFSDADPVLKATFKRFNKKNPHVYKLFEEFSLQAFERKSQYSHWAIAQRIRWYTNIETTGCDFKLSNDLIALFARLVVYRNPALRNFFTFKKMKIKRSVPSGFRDTNPTYDF